MLAAAVAAIPAVLAQIFWDDGPVHTAGFALSSACWLVFVAEVAIMLTVSPTPRRWASGHRFEIAVCIIAFPGWQLVASALIAGAFLPAFEAIKFIKIAKSLRVIRRKRRRRVVPPTSDHE